MVVRKVARSAALWVSRTVVCSVLMTVERLVGRLADSTVAWTAHEMAAHLEESTDTLMAEL